MPVIRQHPSFKVKMDEDIVCAPSDRGTSANKSWLDISDERTKMNVPLVCLLSCQGHRRVAMYGTDKL